MLRLFYFLLLSIWVVFSLPIFLYRRLILKKKTPIWKKFFIPRLDEPLGSDVIWVHAVSLGEMKVVLPIVSNLSKVFKFDLVITTQTETGFEFAKTVFKKHVYYMPVDFHWLQKAFVKRIRCKFFFLIESDFWYENLLQLKNIGAELVLLNGKMSDKSHARWKKFPFLACKLFSRFDRFFVQNDEAFKKYSDFIDQKKLSVCGNLKIAKEPQFKDPKFPHLKGLKIACISCSHEGEEVELFQSISGLIEANWTILIAPRHPERFNSVFYELKKVHSDISRLTEEKITSLIIVNQMGVLNEIYSQAKVVIMAGSYSSKKGGHDIFEPILCGALTFFGPHMQAQNELKKLALEYGLGKEVKSDQLLEEILKAENDTDSSKNFQIEIGDFKRNSSMGLNEVYTYLAESFAKKNIKKIAQ